LEVDPENKYFNSQLYYNMSLIKSKIQENNEAINLLNKSIELNPEYSKAFQLRARLNTTVGKFQDAVRDYHEASTLEPQNSELKKQLKEAQKKLKESEKKRLLPNFRCCKKCL